MVWEKVDKHKGLGAGGIVGIVLGLTLFGAGVGVAAYFAKKKWCNTQGGEEGPLDDQDGRVASATPTPTSPTSEGADEEEQERRSLLDHFNIHI